MNTPPSIPDAGISINSRQFALGLAVLFLLTFLDFFLLNHTFAYRDFGSFGYPLAFYGRESWLAGQAPLWNPYSNCGVPFLAQWNTMPLYPFSLFYVIFPAEWALGLFCILHLYGGGVGMFCLARRWTNSDCGAALAGVAFAFSGLAFNCQLWPNNAAALGWMPWLLLAFRRAAFEGGRWVLAASLIGALQALAGAPEIMLQTWLLAPLFCVELSTSHATSPLPFPPVERENSASPSPTPSWFKRFYRIGVTGLLVMGLAAVQLLPFLQLLGTSHRTAGYASGVWPMPAWGWGNFLVPLFHCYSWNSGVFYQPDQFWISSYYVGAFTLVLAVLAAIRWRQRATLVFAVVTLLALILALGQHGLLYPLFAKLPGANLLRYPIKFVVTATLLLPVLAALGLRWLEIHSETKPHETRRVLLFAGGVGLLVIAGLLGEMKWRPLRYDEFSATVSNGLERGALLMLVVVVAWFYLRARQPKSRLCLGVVLPLLLWLDMVTHAPNLVLPVSPEILRADLVNASQPSLQAGQSRVLVTRKAKKYFYETVLTNAANDFLEKRLAGFANCNLLDHLPKVDGFFSLYPAWHYDLLSGIYNRTNDCPPALAVMLGVSHETAPDNFVAWHPRTQNLPLVTAGQRPEFRPASAIKEMVTSGNWDPRQMVLLDASLLPQHATTNTAKATVRLIKFSPQEIDFEVVSDAPTWVVISQTYYPNWKAWANRAPTPVRRANHAFQAIEVPNGTSQVRLAYVDLSFQLGLAISGLTLLGCLGAWLSCNLFATSRLRG